MQDFLKELNSLRKNPVEYSKKFEVFIKAMSRIKKSNVIDCLVSYKEKLLNTSNLSEFILSDELSDLAKKELNEFFKDKKNFKFQQTFDELRLKAENVCRGFGNLYMFFDQGDSEFLIARLASSEYDLNKTNCESIISKDFKYVGIYTKEIGDETYTVIILADNVEINTKLIIEDFSELKKAFDFFDVNENGILDSTELKECLKALNLEKDNPTLFGMIEKLDSENSSKGVSFKEFCRFFDLEFKDYSSDDGLKLYFDLFIDDPNNQYISSSSIKRICNFIGMKLNPNEEQDILDKAALNGKTLSFEEFKDLMKLYYNK